MTATIAIVGGGCAGLGAANALLMEQDISVVLIEANNRLGGRAWTSGNPAGLPIDMGPQFLQDPAFNPWYAIMRALGIGSVQPEIKSNYRVRVNGQWSDRAPPPAGTAYFNALIDQGYEAAKLVPNRSPLAIYAGDDQYVLLALGSNGLGAISESAEPWQYVAADRARQDDPGLQAQNNDMRYRNEGVGENNIYVTGGLGTLVAAFAADLQHRYGDRLEVRRNCEVAAIRSTGQGVAIGTASGESIAADYCIVTPACSAIDRICFDPPLPRDRQVAHGHIQLGSYKKIAFRPTRLPQIEQDGETIAVETENYIHDAAGNGCWQYFRLPTDDSILICAAAGNFARRLDALDDAVVLQRVQALLRGAYAGGDFTPLEGKYIVTNWTSQPHVWGAYSFTRCDGGPADDPTALGARLKLQEPHGRIHFAGEASWAAEYGTIAGAYKSGVRAAEQIVQRLGA